MLDYLWYTITQFLSIVLSFLIMRHASASFSADNYVLFSLSRNAIHIVTTLFLSGFGYSILHKKPSFNFTLDIIDLSTLSMFACLASAISLSFFFSSTLNIELLSIPLLVLCAILSFSYLTYEVVIGITRINNQKFFFSLFTLSRLVLLYFLISLQPSIAKHPLSLLVIFSLSEFFSLGFFISRYYKLFPSLSLLVLKFNLPRILQQFRLQILIGLIPALLALLAYQDRFILRELSISSIDIRSYDLSYVIISSTVGMIIRPLHIKAQPLYIALLASKGKLSFLDYWRRILQHGFLLVLLSVALSFGAIKIASLFIFTDLSVLNYSTVLQISLGQSLTLFNLIVWAPFFVRQQVFPICIILLLSCIINYLLTIFFVPLLGWYGAALSTLLSSILMTLGSSISVFMYSLRPWNQ